jgi:mycothiol synthase
LERVVYTEASDDLINELTDFNNIMRAEAWPEDPPLNHEQQLARARNQPSTVHRILHLIRDSDGRLIAASAVGYEISSTNQHLCDASISVLPEHRREGLGRSLLPSIVDEARKARRTLIFSHSIESVPEGARFAESLGAKPGIREHVNRLVLGDVDRSQISAWLDEAPGRAPGYSLIWHDGPYGPELEPRMIPVHELMNHAPTEDLEIEDWKISPEEMREWEKSMAASGNERWSLIVRHDATDTLVGFTEVAWNPNMPDTVHQMGTAVDPEHRGHALGKWLKAAMIDRVIRERPHAVDIRTGNADSNAPMLGINKQLGFKPYRAMTGYQLKVEDLAARLGAPS